MVRNPISVRSLEPNVAAPWTIDDYRAGRDPAMAAVANALQSRDDDGIVVVGWVLW